MKTWRLGAVLFLKWDTLLLEQWSVQGFAVFHGGKVVIDMQSVRRCVGILISAFRNGNMLAPHHTSVRSWVQSTESMWKNQTDMGAHALVASRAKTDESYWSASLTKLASPWPMRDSVSEQGEQHPGHQRLISDTHTHYLPIYAAFYCFIVPISSEDGRKGKQLPAPQRAIYFIMNMAQEKPL